MDKLESWVLVWVIRMLIDVGVCNMAILSLLPFLFEMAKSLAALSALSKLLLLPRV